MHVTPLEEVSLCRSSVCPSFTRSFVFAGTRIQYKLQPIVCVKLGEEQFAEKDDK